MMNERKSANFNELHEAITESRTTKVKMPDGRVFDAEIFSAKEIAEDARQYLDRNALDDEPDNDPSKPYAGGPGKGEYAKWYHSPEQTAKREREGAPEARNPNMDKKEFITWYHSPEQKAKRERGE